MDDDTQDDTDEYDISESLRSFRGAGSRVSEGIEHLYYGGKERLADQHVVVQAAVTLGLWFAGNWVYNHTAPLVVETTASVISNVSPASITSLLLELIGDDFAFPTEQLSGILISILVGQTRLQTRRLKRVEAKVTNMSEASPAATDGGTPAKIGGGGLGGALAGVFAGASFGPGGVLAGIYLGYVVGERLTRSDVPVHSTEQS